MHTHGVKGDGALRRERLTRRVRAIENLLSARGVVTSEEIDDVIDLYTRRLWPEHGTNLVSRAWTDEAFKHRLIDDPMSVIKEIGYDGSGASHSSLPFLRLHVVENTPDLHNVIVCTLCSCYPVALLGPQPSWYKSLEYRSRVVMAPRQVLSEFGLVLSDEVKIRVWDSNAETRYMVLPERPAGTEDWSERELRRLVTRDALIGVSRALSPDEISN